MKNKRKKPSPQTMASQTKNTCKFSKEERRLAYLKGNYARRRDNIALIRANQDLASAILMLIEQISQKNGGSK